MNTFVRVGYRLLGRWSERGRDGKPYRELQRQLLRADWPMRAGAFRAALWLGSALVGLVGVLVAIPIALMPQAPPLSWLVLPLVGGTFAGGMTYTLAPLLLRNAAVERAKEIDENMPHGLNYMLALANAGLAPRDVWASLARAKVFGALAGDAERIVRDLDVFGLDLITALKNAQDRTPSTRFREFLQGAISAFQSGVELESYLRHKGEQYQREAVEEQLKTIDTMGLMAEAFLVVVVAAPLFLIILLTVMSINQGEQVLFYGYAMVLVFIPVTQLIIGTLVRSMNPTVWT
ncbi:MAG TPA: type II secretion system F family protein [Candidatus Thermoplasmatota archaeon]|nr:type II secretion system F family protein [Candidatus Thermoplasmatota archaeon]